MSFAATATFFTVTCLIHLSQATLSTQFELLAPWQAYQKPTATHKARSGAAKP